MFYNIKELLKLPDEEKIAIADLLYTSVNEEVNVDESAAKWYQDEKICKRT